jgi:trans-aconitate 2-methyltransferase
MAHEFDGQKYTSASAHQKEWGNKIIAEFNLKGNEHILDLGCGDGVLTAELASLAPDGFVLGIDASRGMIEAARKLETKNLSFRIADINAMDFKDEFDVVFSNATLHWVKDHCLLLRNTFLCLKNDGILRFNFGAEGNCSNFTSVSREAIGGLEFAKYFSGFEWPWYMPSPEAYELIIRNIPFREIKVWGENADRYFPDVSAMVKWLDQPSLVPFIEHLPEPSRKGFRDHIVKKMIEATLQKDGTCFETFRRINVFARK